MPDESSETALRYGAGTAVALGWNVAEISAFLRAARPDEPRPTSLDAPLTASEEQEQIVKRITARVAKLQRLIDVESLQEALGKATEDFLAEMTPASVRPFHTSVSSVLLAEDSRLGKAYRLGISLCELCTEPEHDSTQRWYDAERVTRITRYLGELQTVLPDHTAMGVLGSLQAWKLFARETTWDDRHMTLPAQGRLWRGLLSGEKSAVQTLKLTDYVYAGQRAVFNAIEISSRVLKSVLSSRARRSVLIALGVLTVVGIAVIARAAVTADGGTAAAGGALTLLSGGSAIGFIKKVSDGIEGVWDSAKPALLGGALDIVVVAAITELPRPEVGGDLREHEALLSPTGFVRSGGQP